MMSKTETVTVSILDKDYQVSCSQEEVAELRESASYLDKKMREIKSSSSVIGLDRVAVMAALNITNDYLAQTRKTSSVVELQQSEIQSLSGKVDQALTRFKSI